MPFDQRAWFQLIDRDTRYKYRNEICSMLCKAYSELGKTTDANNITKVLDEEVKLFDNKGK